jgi:hypothetical protein
MFAFAIEVWPKLGGDVRLANSRVRPNQVIEIAGELAAVGNASAEPIEKSVRHGGS